MSSIPKRIRCAVELLELEEGQSVLEIGGGNGRAAGLVLDRIGPEGVLTFVDRSPVAIGRTTAGNRDHVAAGRLRPVEADIASLDADPATFDRAFAVNVNVFWTKDPVEEMNVLRTVLRPDGFLLLVYEAPAVDRVGEIAGNVAEHLSRHGFSGVEEIDGSLLAVKAVMTVPGEV